MTSPYIAVQCDPDQALNAQLETLMLEWAGSRESVGANQGRRQSYFEHKWLSPDNLHQASNPCLVDLAGLILTLTQQRIRRTDGSPASLSIASMWCMVSRAGLSGEPHNHKGRVSCAYYVNAGSSGGTDGGEIVFYPAPGQQPVPLVPKNGMLVLFPSKLFHSVNAYTGTQPRIVVSANMV